MKLYYMPGACSLASHIVANEAALPIEFAKVDRSEQGKQVGGTDYLTINPRGTVPALVLDDGALLTEGVAILQYLASLAPEKGLAPAYGTMDHWRLLETLNFIATELHKNFGALFNPNSPDAIKETAKATLRDRFAVIDGRLGAKDYLTGANFGIADAYLLTVLFWANFIGVDISACAALQAFLKRATARPAVQKTLAEEGLPTG